MFAVHASSAFFPHKATEIEQKGKPMVGVNGNFRLKLCLSDDHQFYALLLFCFGDFNYNPVFKSRSYKGKDADTIVQLL